MKNRKGWTKSLYLSDEEINELVTKAQEGDQRAFTKLFQRYKPILYKVGMQNMFNASDEDVEDEISTFMASIFTKYINTFDRSKAKFDTWITFCFRNQLKTIGKRKKRIKGTSLDEVYGKQWDDHVEYEVHDTSNTVTKNMINATPSFRKIARVMLTHLTKLEATVLVDKYWYGLNDTEIEEKLNIPKGTAWYRKKCAVAKLRKHIRIEDYIQ
jgi:RNA polymerase sigma-70 factor, ECF subfamily